MRTATTTLTRTNWAIRTKMTKKMGAMMRDTQQFLMQSAEWSQFSRSVSFMMPFQLSPVATRNSVKKAIPKLAKWACSPSPWHGWSSSHSWQAEHGDKTHETFHSGRQGGLVNFFCSACNIYPVDQTIRLRGRRIWRRASRIRDRDCRLAAGLASPCPAKNGFLWPSSAISKLKEERRDNNVNRI